MDLAITGRPAIAALALGNRPQVVAAARDEASGRLRLTAYDVTDRARARARPRRLGDTGNFGPRMTHSPDLVSVMEGIGQLVASAVRHSENGRIIVSTWRPPDDSVSFIREGYSGAETTPEIESTPSLVSMEGRESADFLTGAIGKNGNLALYLWSDPDPIRTSG